VTAIDTKAPAGLPAEQRTIGTEVQAYFDKLRGGDVGSAPAILGLVVLMIFFSILKPDTFASSRNLANLLPQSAPVIFLAMGLIFVLLLGEIDLGAGYTAGVSAAVLAVQMTNHGWSWPIAFVACLLTGLAVGLTVGLLVARLNIPSFVVTLASFLGLQGVLLLIIGEGGTIPVNSSTILAVMNNNMSPVAGWIFFLIVVVGYAGSALLSVRSRQKAGLSAVPPLVIAAKIIALVVILGGITFFLNQERSSNVMIKSLKGVPVIVPVTLIFMLVLGFVLTRTSFGRHVYAVGGNAEAARRAGINVPGIKIACFMIASAMAAMGGILYASYANSVSPSTGGSSSLLYAVGAAVIGGTSLFGGKGRIIDAILGGLVIGVVQNGLPLITQKAGVQFIVTGLVLLLAASVDALSRRRAAATGR
jgi:D-xylose transport system permease protein